MLMPLHADKTEEVVVDSEYHDYVRSRAVLHGGAAGDNELDARVLDVYNWQRQVPGCRRVKWIKLAGETTSQNVTDPVRSFFLTLKSLSDTNPQRGAVLVFRKLHDLLIERKLSECDNYLSRAASEVHSLHRRVGLAFLAATNRLPPADLPSRSAVLVAVRHRMVKDLGEVKARETLEPYA